MSRPPAPRPPAAGRPPAPTRRPPARPDTTDPRRADARPGSDQRPEPAGVPRQAARARTAAPDPGAAPGAAERAATGARWLRGVAARGGDRVRAAGLRSAVVRGAARGASDGAPRWLSGLAAGSQAALLSLLVVVMPAVAAYVATSADPTNADVGWTRSVAVGAALWLLGHGGPLVAGGATVTLVPLGITGLAVFAGYASARRSSPRTPSAWLSGVAGYVAVTVLVLLLAGEAGPLGAGPAAVLRLVLGAAAVAALGLGLGVARPRRVRAATERWWGRIPHPLRAGAVGGVVAVSALVAVAALVTGLWVVSSRASAGDVVAGLGVDAFGGLLLAVAQLAVAPDLVTWAFAWLAGPGFHVGEGTLYSPAAVVPGPLPALPLLGALPTAGGGPAQWVPLAVVGAGALAGVWLHQRLVVRRARDVLVAVGCLGAVSGVLAGAVVALGSGAAGPGRLAVVGASSLAVGAWALAGTLLGAVLVAVPGDRAFRRAVGARRRAAWDRVRGRADLDLGDAGADRATPAEDVDGD